MINIKTTNNFKKIINFQTKKMVKYKQIFRKNKIKIKAAILNHHLQTLQVIQMKDQKCQEVQHLIDKMIDLKIIKIMIKRGKIKCKLKKIEKGDF